MEALLDLVLEVNDQRGNAGTLICGHAYVYAPEVTNGFIIGYPLLKAYALQVDGVNNCLADTLPVAYQPLARQVTKNETQGQEHGTGNSHPSVQSPSPDNRQSLQSPPIESSQSVQQSLSSYLQIIMALLGAFTARERTTPPPPPASKPINSSPSPKVGLGGGCRSGTTAVRSVRQEEVGCIYLMLLT